MNILAIETSCDETAAAVIKDGITILSNVVASSVKLHETTGGIIPEVAAREQVKCVIPVINKSISQCNNVTMKNIDAIAVTIGPGLNGSLLVGVETAKTIAYATGKPLIPINHIFAHIYANWLNTPQKPDFPAIALVVSGGHTELFLILNHQKIKWIGGTRDDAAGEAFDKTARILGLGFPGGPAIAEAAINYQPSSTNRQFIKLPRPMINSGNLEFSFSGLKTAVFREINKLKSLKKLNDETIQQLSYEIQESITDVLVEKTLRAAKQYGVKSVLLGGGVAANKKLSEKFNLKIENLKLSRRLRDPAEAGKINLYIPPPPLCTDNAAYIGSFAFFHNHPLPWQEINTQPDLAVEV